MDPLIQSVARRYAQLQGAVPGSWTPEGHFIPSDPYQHYKVVCKVCGTIVQQCRCRSPNRITVLTICKRCAGITAASKIEDPNDVGILQSATEARKALGLHSDFVKQKQRDIREVNNKLKQIALDINDNADLTNRVLRRFLLEVIGRYPKIGPISDWKDADLWVADVKPIKITTDDEGWPYDHMGDQFNAIKDVLSDMKTASGNSLVIAVARRYAMAIGDVPKLIHDWELAMVKYKELEDELPQVLKAKEYLDQHDDEPIEGEKKRQYSYFNNKRYDYLFFPKFSLESLQRLGIRNIFLGLIQQYELPSQVRKKVEACSRFYEKTRFAKSKSFEDSIQAFKKVLSLYREHLAIAKDAFSQATVRGADAPTILRAGPFRVVNTGGFDESTMDTCVKVIEKAVHLLSKKGLGKVCYGDALISNTLAKPKVLAFYLVGSDEFFVRANLKGKEGAALQTILHELAHRLYAKFLQSQHREISGIYRRIQFKQSESISNFEQDVLKDPEKAPKAGATLVDKGKTYVVDGTEYKGLRSGYQIHLHQVDDPSKKVRISLSGWISLKGFKPESKPGSGFISPYASTDVEENFAEMIAFYCMDELPQDQVEMLEKVL